MSERSHRPRVIIIGAGFGGLYAAKKLANKEVDVLLIDRNNYHLFSPLIYQVATSALDPSEVAYPVRGIMRGKRNIQFLLGSVEGIDPEAKTVHVHADGKASDEPYDYLIVAAGSQTHYFGNDQIEQHAFGLKSLTDSVVLRNHILKSFEKAAWTNELAMREALTTLVVVGGGPTGLETAGALYELWNDVLRKEFARNLHVRVILVELEDHLLGPYPPRLQEAARRQLEDLGVEVITGHAVQTASDDHIVLDDGRTILTRTLVWAAGVKASCMGEMLGVPLQRGGRVPVESTMQVIGHADIYTVGDLAYLEDEDGKPYPMLIPPAKQQGMLAAQNILRRLKGESQQHFDYSGLKDRGIMATIGRSRAVAWIFYRVQVTGFLAWIAWLGLHIITLMGFRNRISVMINWAWNYVFYDRNVRLILEFKQPHSSEDETPAHTHPVDALAETEDFVEAVQAISEVDEVHMLAR